MLATAVGRNQQRFTAPTERAPLYLASQQILAFLSRPKGRNSYGEDLAEEGGKLPRPKLDKKLSWRLAHLPRAVPFLDRTVS